MLKGILYAYAAILTVSAALSGCSDGEHAKHQSSSISISDSTPKTSNDFIENNSLNLKSGEVRVGMDADQFLSVVPASTVVNQVVKPDPVMPGSLVVRKDVNLDGIDFTVILAREQNPGPYRVVALLTHPR